MKISATAGAFPVAKHPSQTKFSGIHELAEPTPEEKAALLALCQDKAGFMLWEDWHNGLARLGIDTALEDGPGTDELVVQFKPMELNLADRKKIAPEGLQKLNERNADHFSGKRTSTIPEEWYHMPILADGSIVTDPSHFSQINPEEVIGVLSGIHSLIARRNPGATLAQLKQFVPFPCEEGSSISVGGTKEGHWVKLTNGKYGQNPFTITEHAYQLLATDAEGAEESD